MQATRSFILPVHEICFYKILKFVIPTYLTSFFNTLYTIADGIFVSAYAGSNALAAINTVYPIVNILTGIALAFAAGGSSIAALYIGAEKKEKASQVFSVSVILAILSSSLLSFVIFLQLEPMLILLSATPLTIRDCKDYALFWLAGTPVVVGKELFTYFIRTDGSPAYSFLTALCGGIVNILLDYIFIFRMQMGILGAGLATVFGLFTSFLLGIYYFARQKKLLHFSIRAIRLRQALYCLVNGSSEFVDQMATAATTIAFNHTAKAFMGENGIAAVSIIMYLQFLFIGVSFGYAAGVSPLLSYAYGNGNSETCKKLEQYSSRFYTITSVLLFALAFLTAPSGVCLFTKIESPIYHLAVNGMRLYGFAFLCIGFNIYVAIRLTSYGKGKYAGILTFLRSFALPLFFLLLLPKVFGINGIWLAVPAAEILTLFPAVYFSSISSSRSLPNPRAR